MFNFTRLIIRLKLSNDFKFIRMDYAIRSPVLTRYQIGSTVKAFYDGANIFIKQLQFGTPALNVAWYVYPYAVAYSKLAFTDTLIVPTTIFIGCQLEGIADQPIGSFQPIDHVSSIPR
jgi:hypothetical protein